MAADIFVNFPKGKGPTPAQVESVVRNFFGEAAEVEWDQGRWVVLLKGEGTWVFEGIEPDLMPRLRSGRQRGMEVCCTLNRSRRITTQLDVVTRLQDEYTNVLAMGLAKVFARYWKGKVDAG